MLLLRTLPRLSYETLQVVRLCYPLSIIQSLEYHVDIKAVLSEDEILSHLAHLQSAISALQILLPNRENQMDWAPIAD